jgi:hypothetical protein
MELQKYISKSPPLYTLQNHKLGIIGTVKHNNFLVYLGL